MSYTIEEISHELKKARENKGLSQRELRAASGVPQSHISKIENGAVDLRVSSLVALARALDLELTLVPRKTVSAVKSIVRSSEDSTVRNAKVNRLVHKEFARMQSALKNLSFDALHNKELEQFKRQLRELQSLQIHQPELDALQKAYRDIKASINNNDSMNAIRSANNEFQKLRNALAHGRGNIHNLSTVRPAYSLDEDNDA